MRTSRSLLTTVVLSLATLFVFPPSGIAQTQTQPAKYWIMLDGKPAYTELNKQVESAQVSEKAIERRRLKATSSKHELLDRNVSPDYLRELNNVGVEILNTSRWLNAVTAFLDEQTLRDVQSLPFVKDVRLVASASILSVEPEPLTLEQPTQPLDKSLRLDYGASAAQLEMVNAIAPLERGINGTGVTIGILDTEFGGFAHPVFSDMVSDGRLLGYQNLTPGSQTSRHGQYVASIMIGFEEGELIGPGYGADVYAATTEYAPTETNQEEDDWVAGLEWLESQGADVVNSSLGYNEFDAGQNSYSTTDLDGNTAITTIAADIAVSLGVVVVNSAGNEGCNSPTQCWYYIITPADGDSVIAVGGVNPSGAKEGFSSWGPTADGRTKPDVSAQGSSVRFAIPTSGYASGNGTSFASPMVAGVVAQILQVNPLLTPVEVRQILRDSASQSANPDNALGWGIIDADAAILQAQSLDADTPASQPNATSVDVYPNPVTSDVTFLVNPADTGGRSTLEVFDILGRRVNTLWSGTLNTSQRIFWTPSNLPDGIYVYRFSSDSESITGSIVVIQ